MNAKDIKKLKQLDKKLESLFSKEEDLYAELAALKNKCDHKLPSGKTAETISSNGMKFCSICELWPLTLTVKI